MKSVPLAQESHGRRKKQGVKSEDAITFAKPLSLIQDSLSLIPMLLLLLTHIDVHCLAESASTAYTAFFVAVSCSETITGKF